MLRTVGIFLIFFPLFSFAQQEIFIDAQGAMRWQKTKEKAYFFGINYTAPFAYGYRSIKRNGSTIEQAIDNDVYHFARMGLNAFRVHVWDTEITDSAGNLLNNDHLRLFDYLLYKLEQRDIRIMLTPLAFWGNGYPEKDSMTGSFSSKYNKQKVLVEEPAIRAQENYIKQLLAHVNPYTKKKYQDDKFIIGLEINNEPHHSGALKTASDYIGRMIRAAKNAGWKKPVFYNISESPSYAKAVAEADIQGVSFQWYPTGLVANHTLRGNYLPNVDAYLIPFDTIPSYKNKAKMVYEFDAADLMSPVMYPAMARSFRKAGFQWATQFAYDPLATANGNTEYQTHYLNLAYTPEKAISMMIAARIFTDTSMQSGSDNYPADTIFGKASIHPAQNRSEWNSNDAFYYTGSSSSSPLDYSTLKHIAGTGSSEVVKSSGNGTYFLDKLSQGVWRLECMPDVMELEDPFGRAALDRKVRQLEWNELSFTVELPELGTDFQVDAVNKGNTRTFRADGKSFLVNPGVYVLRAKGRPMPGKHSVFNGIRLDEYVVPLPTVVANSAKKIEHEPPTRSTEYNLFPISRVRNQLKVMNPDWRNYKISYPGDSLMEILISDSSKGKLFAWHSYVGDLVTDQATASSLRVHLTSSAPANFRIGLVDIYGSSFFKECNSDSSGVIEIPLSALKSGPSLLLPRPYPGFLPLWFDNKIPAVFRLDKMDKLEFLFYSDGMPRRISIAAISLQ